MALEEVVAPEREVVPRVLRAHLEGHGADRRAIREGARDQMVLHVEGRQPVGQVDHHGSPPGRAQPTEQPVLGAGLVRRQVLADPQDPAATAVRHRERLVIAAALGPDQFGVRRDAPAGA